MNKICNKCKLEKSIDEFSFRNKQKGTKQPYCKVCRKNIDSVIWLTDSDFRVKKLARQKSYKIRNKQYVIEFLLAHPCVDCGESDPIVLDFDHLLDKTKGISEMIEDSSLLTIKKEIEKCEVRCANCHRRKTAKDFNWFKAKILGERCQG